MTKLPMKAHAAEEPEHARCSASKLVPDVGPDSAAVSGPEHCTAEASDDYANHNVVYGRACAEKEDIKRYASDNEQYAYAGNGPCPIPVGILAHYRREDAADKVAGQQYKRRVERREVPDALKVTSMKPRPWKSDAKSEFLKTLFLNISLEFRTFLLWKTQLCSLISATLGGANALPAIASKQAIATFIYQENLIAI